MKTKEEELPSGYGSPSVFNVNMEPIPIDWQRVALELNGHLMAIEAHSEHVECCDRIKDHIKSALTKYNIMTQQEMFTINRDLEDIESVLK